MGIAETGSSFGSAGVKISDTSASQSDERRSDFLLVVVPGARRGKHVLERLRDYLVSVRMQLAVLALTEDKLRSSWSSSVVESCNYIEFEGGIHESDKAMRALLAWTSIAVGHNGAASSRRRICGVMCFDDFGLELAASLCKSLGLPGTSSEVVDIIRDKRRFREVCSGMRGVGVSCETRCIRLTRDVVEAIRTGAMPWTFPSIIKPLRGAGSWFVQRVGSAEDLRAAFPRLSRGLATNGGFTSRIKLAGLVLEEMFIGQEVDVDGWYDDGRVVFAQVNDNRAPLDPSMSEVGGSYPSQRLDPHAVKRLRRLTEETIAAVEAAAGPGCRFRGAFSFEAIYRTEDGQCFPVELNGRFGGAECPSSVEATTGHWLPARAAELALGWKGFLQGAEPASPPEHGVVVSVNVHLAREGILTRLDSSAVTRRAGHVHKLVQKVLWSDASVVGTKYAPGRGSRSCLGWIAVGGDTIEEANANVRAVLDLIVFEIDAERVPTAETLALLGVEEKRGDVDQKEEEPLFEVAWEGERGGSAIVGPIA